MPNDNGKIIVSLLAGATAGIITGLLLAPETGEDARNDLRTGARKWWDDVSKQAQLALQKFQGGATTPDAAVREDKNAADQLFASMSKAEPGDLATPAGDGRSVTGEKGGDYAANHRDDYSSDDEAGETPHRTGVGA